MRESDLPYQPDQPKKEREMSPEAKEIISLFQRAKNTKDDQEQLALVREFHSKLTKILTPTNEGILSDDPKRIKQVILERYYPGLGKSINLGGGTSGQRIFFRNAISTRSEEQAKKIGIGAKRTVIGDVIELESADGNPRWMHYPRPDNTDWKFGGRYWQKYIEIFGDEIVDLEQELRSEVEDVK